MIPEYLITEWRQHAPWVLSSQVEQDLVLSRAIVAIFQDPQLADALAFRGGTALYKLFVHPPVRYSEDLDLVQLRAEPIGATLTKLRATLDPWLGKPRWKQSEGRVTLYYRFPSESGRPEQLRLKLEINTREHFTVFGLRRESLAVDSGWFSGSAPVTTYDLNELLGTKLRALFQRKKGRDLFDLDRALDHADADEGRIHEVFERYMAHQGARVSRAGFERNLAEKLASGSFGADMDPLLAAGVEWDAKAAAKRVSASLLARLGGDPWKGPV